VAGGGIVGNGAQATHKVNAIRNQLLAAGSFSTAQACGQLSKTLTRLDTDNTPDANDYVTGAQVDELSVRITALRNNLGC
jgi:hypothetical protein